MKQSILIAAAALGLLATAALAADAKELPDGPEKGAVVAVCTVCHDASEITTRQMPAEKWDNMISKMVDLGAAPTPEQRVQILAYLTRNYTPGATPGAAPAAPTGSAPAAPAP